MNNYLGIHRYDVKKDGRPYTPPFSMVYAKTEADANVLKIAFDNAGYKTSKVQTHKKSGQIHIKVYK